MGESYRTLDKLDSYVCETCGAMVSAQTLYGKPYKKIHDTWHDRVQQLENALDGLLVRDKMKPR